MKKRFALVIGAMKSGTTTLFRQLGSHPQVLPCRVKEPKFFTDDQKWSLGLDWYRSLWDFREPDERIALEASTDYAKHPSVPCPAERIARTPAGFRFIYLLRNPLERIESHHTHAWAEGWAEGTLEQGVLRHHVDVSRYAEQLARYREHFPAEDFLLLRFEELSRDPLAVLRRVCRFLEIDPFFAFPDAHVAHNATVGRLVKPRDGGPWWGRLRGLRRLARYRAPRVERKFRLASEQREFVLEELRDDLARLRAEWGFDPSPWNLGA